MFCASFKRRAIVWRMRDMRTRSSRGPRSRGADTGAAGALTAEAGLAFAAKASPFVIRPSLPVPEIEAASRLFSLITRSALGIGGLPDGALGAGVGAGAGFAADVPPEAPAINVAIVWPTVATSPSATR